MTSDETVILDLVSDKKGPFGPFVIEQQILKIFVAKKGQGIGKIAFLIFPGNSLANFPRSPSGI